MLVNICKHTTETSQEKTSLGDERLLHLFIIAYKTLNVKQ